ncbi:MAG: bifunctional precorrin-2 dehydrogenase/sirohydrochlorin ferrochelatase [Nitrospinae bacterium]|nr:bifunctional precorrin-2 dehydrogenase/sirohydrochlorin ferrochelatase [Nitrospinota bacterium]
MIVDWSLKGRRAAVAGGGREATRKVEALLTQDCEILVYAEKVSRPLQRLADDRRIVLRKRRLIDGAFLRKLDRLALVMAATDDKALNRKIVEQARKLRLFAYAADDPEHSDFSHPAAINLYGTVQIAVSTGGKSPLMAGEIRKRVEPVLKKLIKKIDALKIELQGRIRVPCQRKLSTPKARKAFLRGILVDKAINRLLQKEDIDRAETLALEKLERRRSKSRSSVSRDSL